MPSDYPEFRRGRPATGTPGRRRRIRSQPTSLNPWESPPTIAQVHGYRALGGGTHYGPTTDIVIAVDDAYFPLSAAGLRYAVGERSIEPWFQ